MTLSRLPCRRTRAVAALLSVAAWVAGCGKSPAAASEVVVVPAEAQFRASLTVWPDTPERPGRSSPVFSHYRPQLRFTGAPDRTCTLMIPKPATALPPGETMDVLFGCDGELRIHRDQPAFDVLEGGKKIGQGRWLPS